MLLYRLFQQECLGFVNNFLCSWHRKLSYSRFCSWYCFDSSSFHKRFCSCWSISLYLTFSAFSFWYSFFVLWVIFAYSFITLSLFLISPCIFIIKFLILALIFKILLSSVLGKEVFFMRIILLLAFWSLYFQSTGTFCSLPGKLISSALSFNKKERKNPACRARCQL